LILNPEKKEIYRWMGPKSLPKLRDDSEENIDQIIQKFPQFKLIKLDKKIPDDIQIEIDNVIDRSHESKQKFDRSPPYTGFLILSYVVFIALCVSYSFILFPMGWDRYEGGMSILIVNVLNFEMWNYSAKITIIITIVLFSLLFVTSVFTLKVFLISTSIIGIFIQVGTYFYVNLGIYLFDFQANSFQSPPYQILVGEVVVFSVLNLLSLITTLIPLIISLKAIYSQSIKISLKDWIDKKKAEKKLFETKKVSVISKKSDFIPFDPKNPDKSYTEEEIRKLNEL
jgi:hypothetical protein